MITTLLYTYGTTRLHTYGTYDYYTSIYVRMIGTTTHLHVQVHIYIYIHTGRAQLVNHKELIGKQPYHIKRDCKPLSSLLPTETRSSPAATLA